LTFAIGPKLLDDEEAPDEENPKAQNRRNEGDEAESDEEQANPRISSGRTAEEEEEYDNETTTLLPNSIARREEAIREEMSVKIERWWVKLPLVVRHFFTSAGSFLNAPLTGAIIGGAIGLAPPLHRVFFNKLQNGGIFKAWLTNSVMNIGELFPALQLVVVVRILHAQIDFYSLCEPRV
jgi:hypothetical protein